MYFLFLLLAAMFLSNPVIAVITLLGALLARKSLQIKAKSFSEVIFYWLLLILIALTNPLFSHNGATVLFFLNRAPITLEALVYGVVLGVTVIGVLFWCQCYSRVFTSDKSLYLFGRVIPKLSLVLTMAIRFLPLLKRQAEKVSMAQKAMGLYSSEGFADRVRAHFRIMTAVR